MNSLPRNPPRFVPTLTEVIDVATLDQSSAPIPPTLELEHLVQLVLQRVDAAFAYRWREVAEALLKEQLEGLRLSMRGEIEPLVRQSVMQVMSSARSQDSMK